MDHDTENPERERLLSEIRPLREELKTLRSRQKKRRREIRLALAALYADADDTGVFVGQDEPSYHAKKDKEAIQQAQTLAAARMQIEGNRRIAAFLNR